MLYTCYRCQESIESLSPLTDNICQPCWDSVLLLTYRPETECTDCGLVIPSDQAERGLCPECYMAELEFYKEELDRRKDIPIWEIEEGEDADYLRDS